MSAEAVIFGTEGAARILGQHFGLSGKITPLTAERDENFRVQSAQGQFVLKVFGHGTPEGEADMLCAVLRHLQDRAPSLPVPRLAEATPDTPFVRLDGGRLAVLYTFLPGTPLMEVGRSIAQSQACGALAAELGHALRDFSHPAMNRRLIWDLRRLPELAAIAADLNRVPFADFVLPFIERFAGDLAPALDALPRQFVHNDLNARNVIVAIENHDRIAGIIDFGDSIHTARVCDIAVGMIGQMADRGSAGTMIAAFLSGYERIAALAADEREILPQLVAARVVQNVVMTAYYQQKSKESGHFSGFDEAYFGWRVAFVRDLILRRI